MLLVGLLGSAQDAFFDRSATATSTTTTTTIRSGSDCQMMGAMGSAGWRRQRDRHGISFGCCCCCCGGIRLLAIFSSRHCRNLLLVSVEVEHRGCDVQFGLELMDAFRDLLSVGLGLLLGLGTRRR
jgi:hypothetical protein